MLITWHPRTIGSKHRKNQDTYHASTKNYCFNPFEELFIHIWSKNPKGIGVIISPSKIFKVRYLLERPKATKGVTLWVSWIFGVPWIWHYIIMESYLLYSWLELRGLHSLKTAKKHEKKVEKEICPLYFRGKRPLFQGTSSFSRMHFPKSRILKESGHQFFLTKSLRSVPSKATRGVTSEFPDRHS